jgi:hypothetical protein
MSNLIVTSVKHVQMKVKIVYILQNRQKDSLNSETIIWNL